LIKIIIKEENFKWHLEAFASEPFIFSHWPACFLDQYYKNPYRSTIKENGFQEIKVSIFAKIFTASFS